MGAVRRRARVDANHGEIVAALRSCGWTVIDTSRLGSGFPDLLIARGGRIELVEVKDGAKPLSRQKATAAECQVYAQLLAAGVKVQYVTGVDQIARL